MKIQAQIFQRFIEWSSIMSERKIMSVEEFQKSGLLQEVNRRFLHPIGLAISIVEDLDTGKVHFGEIFDYSAEADGMIFAEEVTSTSEWKEKAARVEELFEAKRAERERVLGYHVQPV